MDKPTIRPTGVYQVRDTVGETVTGPIFTARHKAAAIRIFTDAINDENTSLNKHMRDYELVQLGQQDETTGELFAEIPEIILKGSTYADMLEQPKEK